MSADVASQTPAEWISTPAGDDVAPRNDWERTTLERFGPMVVEAYRTAENEVRAKRVVGYTPTLEPQGPHTERLAYSEVDYWHGLTAREMSIWSAGYRHAEFDYEIAEEDRL